MFRMLPFSNLYHPEDAPGNSPPMGKEDMIDFLGDDALDDNNESQNTDTDESESQDKSGKDKTKDTRDKEKTIDKDSKDDEDDSEESDDELKELEEELNEDVPNEEQLELVTPVRRAQILKKYPNLFKDFPYLEKAYYRDRQFTELLPTIDDAKSAIDKAKTLDSFEEDLLKGNTENMLLAAKNSDVNAFHKIVDNYLPTLAKVDGSAYSHVIGNVVKQTIIAMVSEARTSGNEGLQNAAQLLNQFVFGSTRFEQPKNLAKEDTKNDAEEKLREKERNFAKQQFNRISGELHTKVNNSLKSTIEQHIDPKQSMSDYVKRTASREAFETLDTLIKKDSQFKVLVDKLWERAEKSDYSEESINKVRSAFLAKAKSLLPSVIKKARNEALRGMGKKVKDTDDTRNNDRRRSTDKDDNKGSRTPNNRGNSGVPAGMSTLDFLMSED